MKPVPRISTELRVKTSNLTNGANALSAESLKRPIDDNASVCKLTSLDSEYRVFAAVIKPVKIKLC